MPAATSSFGIPIQSLTAGSDYTLIDARYAMKASSITVWAAHIVQFEFGGGMTVVTDGPMSIPLAQPVTIGTTVKVTCRSTGPSCYFQFWLVGS
jgi:hypothetical protein